MTSCFFPAHQSPSKKSSTQKKNIYLFLSGGMSGSIISFYDRLLFRRETKHCWQSYLKCIPFLLKDDPPWTMSNCQEPDITEIMYVRNELTDQDQNVRIHTLIWVWVVHLRWNIPVCMSRLRWFIKIYSIFTKEHLGSIVQEKMVLK